MATFLDPRPTIFDSAGVRVLSGCVWFYEAGTVNTLKAIYSNHLLTSPMTNPVPLDADGRVPQIYYEEGSYKVKVQKQTGFLPPPNDIWQDVWITDWVDGGDVVATLGNYGNMVYALNLSILRGIDPTVAPVVMVLGNTNTGDGGGGVYQWAGSVSTPDDNGMYIQRDLGGTGRFIRIVDPCASEMSIRIWCGDSTSVIDAALSAAFSYCATNKIPLSFPSGNYKLSGTTEFLGSGLSIVAYEGAKFKLVTPGALTFSCPARIESKSAITDNSVLFMIFNGDSKLSKLEYQWFDGMTTLAYESLIPLYINSEIIVPDSVSRSLSFSPCVIGANAKFTMGTASVIGFPVGFTVEGLQERKIFYGTVFNIQYAPSISLIQAEWYGVGIDAGDQSVQLTTAMTDAHAFNLELNVPTTTYTGAISLDYIKIRATGLITLSSLASIANVYVLNDIGQPAFNCSTSTNLYIINDTICPEWYGAISGTSDNSIPLRIMLNNAGLTGAQITGRNLPYAYINPIEISELYGKMRMKDISLNYTPNTGVALTLSHTPSWENVKITCTNWSIVSLSCPSMIEDGFMRDCSFYGKGIRLSSRDTSTFVASFDFDNCTVDGLDPSIVFSNCHAGYNIDIHHSRFIGNASVAIANQFSDSSAYIQNIKFNNNIVDCTGGSNDNSGNLFLVSQKADTVVKNVRATDNQIVILDSSTKDYIVSISSGSGSWNVGSVFISHKIYVLNNSIISNYLEGGNSTGSPRARIMTTKGVSRSLRFFNNPQALTAQVYLWAGINFLADLSSDVRILVDNAFVLSGTGLSAPCRLMMTAENNNSGTNVSASLSPIYGPLDTVSKRITETRWLGVGNTADLLMDGFIVSTSFEMYPDDYYYNT
jgi:hypothetical protein